MEQLLADVSPYHPVLIAGPTASGKSALAIAIAEAQGGVVVNADASQVYACWRVLTARPTKVDEARAPHRLFGHLSHDAPYSTGHWLREVAPFLNESDRPIIVGGTGLYLSALTQGLADIPAVPAEIRARANALTHSAMLADISTASAARVDTKNRARVQRAWEVEEATGRSLADWHSDTPGPLLPRERATCLVLDAPKEWLTPRIELRFARMLDNGGLEEAEAMRDSYDPALLSCKAIGVAEAMGVVTGTMSREAAITSATIATRQYAKRQRTWFRSKMADWRWVDGARLSMTMTD